MALSEVRSPTYRDGDRISFLPSLSLWERVRVRAYGPPDQLILVVECLHDQHK
jgi:hypothetical protein